MRARIPALTLLAITALAACGDDDGEATSATTAAPATTAAAATTTAPATTAAATATTAAPAAGAATKVEVTLPDRQLLLDTQTLRAGVIEFTAKNTGNAAHEFVIIKGESYAALPKESNGAVTESALPAGALIGRTGRIAAGASETKTFTLEPGKYVLLCNISFGPNSHAGAGQRLDVSVS